MTNNRPVFGGMFDMMRRNTPSQQQSAGEGQPNQGQNQEVGGSGVGRGAGQASQQQQRGAAPPVLTRPRAPALLPIKRDGFDEGLGGAPTGQDSITLGQLRAHAAAIEKKQKMQQFDFRYDDTDTIMNELQEFYPYVEMVNISKQSEKFHGSFNGDWTSAPLSKRRSYIEVQLEQLESPIHDTRRTAQGRLLYLLQGAFEETTSPEMQLHWVIENAKAVRAVDGVATIVTGLRDAARKYTASADDKAPSSSAPPGTVPAQVDPYDDRSAELMDLLGMLYFIVEVFRTDETFGDELMAMSPPLPLVLFHMVASLKDRLPRGFPVKKVLLLLWKTLLACLGGMKEVSKARALSRELSGLPAENKNFTKATPVDISSWRRDTAVKYPTFAPPTSVIAGVSNEKLAEGIKPIPSRPNYHSTEIPASQSRNSQMQTSPAASGSNPLPGTPAPSPPPSPKPKKQQYQTDPTRPFVFPYSRASANAPISLVPFAISEADNLYHRHEYISLGLYQLYQAREECMREERGLGKRGLIGFSTSQWDDEDEEAEEAMRREWKYEEEEIDAINQGNKEGAKLAREKKAAARRLHRVEIIYKNTLPIQQSCVVVLLKLLLATVTSPGAAGGNLAAGMPQGVTSPTQEVPPAQENAPPPTEEEIDIARHREITSKAVSAILLLLLKWFKASHILKFHYFAQLLFDSNCALLVLKMFGLTDLMNIVQTKNEVEDSNFFRYCQLNCSRVRPSPEDELLLRQPPKKSPQLGPTDVSNADGTACADGEIEYISDYSWRNFFTTVNFLKILQKITKHRNHRTYMLTTYKSSQILKRMLKVNHPMSQLQILKLIKSQMPWCGRKWRQTNMKVITSIYLNCRPELRDDWLAGTDQETELEDALPQEYALRSLVQFYNKRHYSAHLAPLPSPEPSHKRSNSTSAVTLEDPALHHAHAHSQVPHGASAGSHPRTSSLGESDVFPPLKSHAVGADLPYNPDGMIEFWLHEYEDILGEVFGGDIVESTTEVWDEFGLTSNNLQAKSAGQQNDQDDSVIIGPHAADKDDRAWNRLTEIMRTSATGGNRTDEEISDSESVVTVGELGEDARLGGATFDSDTDNDVSDEEQSEQEDSGERRLSIGGGKGRRKSGAGENTWEHMSPTLALLPRSPAERRRSSSGGGGSPLRPVIPGKQSHEVILGLGEDVFDDEDDLDTRGPMPIKSNTRDLEEREGGAVDEVEYTYGE
ncbi:uncharacterized protein I206_104384 [Kwoniella pini CBS 10737]|uniref:Cell cycle arrest in response to pheromone-related protein n=1 Tax=Kwoniella pini CBS 10737 TaxID=1296096 RepID=A0A1B9I1V8_9TREE|nr:uncharacterized protein I206_04035 [Kwoniella pini CBS 10737]OCF49514.1 hypothetical protein I206_04035 [Kwoniella pini CBS 10737]